MKIFCPYSQYVFLNNACTYDHFISLKFLVFIYYTSTDFHCSLKHLSMLIVNLNSYLMVFFCFLFWCPYMVINTMYQVEFFVISYFSQS